MGGGSWSQLSWNHGPHLPFRCCRGNNLLVKLHQSEKVEHGLKLELCEPHMILYPLERVEFK